MPGVQQFAEGAHQLGDVVEVQASGGLPNRKSCPLRAGRLTAGGVRSRHRPEAGELEALRPRRPTTWARAGRGDVIQPHIDDGLQRPDHRRGRARTAAPPGHGEVQHVGHVASWRAQLAHGVAPDLHFRDPGAVALAVAIRAAQVDVGENCISTLEARAAAGGAAPVARVEAELAGV